MNKIIKNKIRILIAEHDKHDLEILEHELKKGGFDYESKIAQTENDFSEALKYFVPDIILSDYTFPSFDGPTALKIRERLAPDTPFIFVSGTVGEEVVVELIKSGVEHEGYGSSQSSVFLLCARCFRQPGFIQYGGRIRLRLWYRGDVDQHSESEHRKRLRRL